MYSLFCYPPGMPKISDETRALRGAQILDAAWRCFQRQGVQATTMEEIIAEADMSASAMYRYFANKDDIIATAIATSLSGLKSLLEPVFADSCLDTPSAFVARVAATIDAFTARRGYNLSTMAVHGWSESQHNPAVRDRLRGHYLGFREMLAARATSWRSAGGLPPGADPDAVGNALLSLILGYVVQAAVMRDVNPAALAAGLEAIERCGGRHGVDAAPPLRPASAVPARAPRSRRRRRS